jgi:hypothetical protein
MVKLRGLPDHVHCLMISRLAGNITEEEERLLEQLIHEDPMIKREWESLRYQFPQERIDRFQELDWLEADEIIALPLLRHNLIFLIIRWAAVAIAVIIVIGLTILYFYGQH